MLLISAATVARARKRYVQEAHLIALACSAAPAGHARWTLQLLADQVVELEFAESISLETVRQLLKKMNSSPGRSKSGVSPR